MSDSSSNHPASREPGLPAEEERRLARLIRSGDRDAFVTLFREYHDPLCAFAERMLSSTDEAQDAVVEVFARIWESREDLEVRVSMRSYLYRAVRNGALRVLRHRRVVDETRDRAATAASSPGMGEAPPGPEEELAGRELEDRIRRAIDDLPPRCREAFTHHRWQGLSYAEIAEVMGVSVRTVENQIGRALELLREALVDRD